MPSDAFNAKYENIQQRFQGLAEEFSALCKEEFGDGMKVSSTNLGAHFREQYASVGEGESHLRLSFACNPSDAVTVTAELSKVVTEAHTSTYVEMNATFNERA